MSYKSNVPDPSGEIFDSLVERLEEVTLEMVKLRDQLEKVTLKYEISQKLLQECKTFNKLLLDNISTLSESCPYHDQCPVREALRT